MRTKEILPYSEAIKLPYAYDNIYNSDLVNTQALCAEVQEFFPCEVACTVLHGTRHDFISSSESKDDLCDFINNIFVRLIVDGTKDLNITKNYKGKYHIYLHDLNDFNDVVSYQQRNLLIEKAGIKEPNNIGKLSTKKIQDWVDYYLAVYELISKECEQKNSEIDTFLKSLEGLDVKWYEQEKRGSIVKGGMEYSFDIKNGYVYEKLEKHYSVESNLSNFLKMSENKL